MAQTARRGDILWKRGDPVQKPTPVVKDVEAIGRNLEAAVTLKTDEAEAPIKVYQCRSAPVRYDIHDYYDIGKTLGEGSTGKVKLAVHKLTKQRFAMKMIDLKNSALGPMVKSIIENEIAIMKLIEHPNCVKLYEVLEQCWSRTHVIFLVLEELCGGELLQRLLAGPFSEKDVSQVARDVLKAAAYLHDEAGIVHRDIKPENLLYTAQGPNARIKLADFGLAATLDPRNQLRDMCGTPGYVAPEVLNPRLTGDVEVDGVLVKAGYGPPVDVWSVGIMTYECLCGFTPFQSEDPRTTLRLTVRGAFDFPSPYWDHISDAAKDFIRLTLTLDPGRRPTAQSCLSNPWIAEARAPPTHPLPDLGSTRAIMMVRKVKLLDGLPPRCLEDITSKLARFVAEPGQILIKAGEPAGAIYFVGATATATLSATGKDQDQETTTPDIRARPLMLSLAGHKNKYIGCGDYFGEAAFLDPLPVGPG
eukprot:CAMPEP_0172188762 /NCGR_PEP_ID=MMETSP1050-20130122/22135_1 /TAXON_ID=233186 /ORGANISM="Cryptomonas curvata, Strain CCAP979/52" /LENGTH=474 /DNA_ID=CAMNT_0012863355 /DNA_START=202 /DNA_END=1623 /DNA_ORIENTATION=-